MICVSKRAHGRSVGSPDACRLDARNFLASEPPLLSISRMSVWVCVYPPSVSLVSDGRGLLLFECPAQMLQRTDGGVSLPQFGDTGRVPRVPEPKI